MFCRNCSKEIDDKAIVCTSCGVKTGEGKKFCQNCGGETNENAFVCVKCGVRLAGQSTSSSTIVNTTPEGKKQLNWIVCLIISIFLGYFSVDRFMMGQVGIGILKLLTCGGCGIWWLIDVILIATKYNFKDVEWVD
jgi:TM2 domain-containing membrane protein YozV